ncbi:MAG: aminoglycoside 3'-phosphotransferase [marine benthic group bacterium]|nr:aminoglycoside 3'-phosphotransferase [Gemmatimonadota bacterium]
MNGETRPLRLPDSLADEYSEWSSELVWQVESSAATYRLTHPSAGVRFAKVKSDDDYPGLPAEADRMRWCGSHLPVPEIVDEGSGSGLAWLVTRGLPGRDATHEEWSADPVRLTRALARGLKRFHSAPVADCPFDFRLDAALRHVRSRVDSGYLVPERDFHPEHVHLDVTEAVALLESTVPTAESLAVCHGDYCPPNILLDGWEAVGFVDLGELGVADRWWDLAIATWSLDWNLGPGFEDLFLSEYGIERDDRRVSFYRLLYDLVS